MTAVLQGGEWSAARPGRNLALGKTRYPFYRKLGGLQGQSGRAENLVPTGIQFRTVQTVGQSLYRLSYPAHVCIYIYIIIIIIIITYKKVKLSHYMSGVPQRVGKGIALLFHDRGTRRG